MSPQCSGGYLFHQWGPQGKCLRCDVTGLVRGTADDERWVDVRSVSVSPSQAHLFGRHSLCEDYPAVDETLGVSSAGSLAGWVARLEVQGFLRRRFLGKTDLPQA